MDALALAIAAALLLVGAAALAVRRWRVTVTAVVVGLCLPLIAYSDDLAAPAWIALVTVAVSPVLAPLTAWTFLRTRALVVLALVAAGVAGPLSMLLYDPFYDLACLSQCDENPFAVAHVSSTVHGGLLSAAFVGAAALTAAAWRGPSRWPLLVLAGSAWLVTLAPSHALEAAILTGAILLALGGLSVAQAFEAGARVADLTRALDGAGDVETTLRSAVGDPGITVSYVLEAGAEVVDGHGLPAYGPVEGQVSTDIIGPFGVVARVNHDPDRANLAALAAAITGPARLAFENGRLAATVGRQAHALEASRRRVVAHADSERRRLERDLHDGAQQHLLALGLVLRTCLDGATDAQARDVLHRGLASTHVALGELRDLSHGFYPASLEQTGLGNALDGVADRAPVPVSVGRLPAGRLPAQVERAIYLLVARAAATARLPLDVSVTRSPDGVGVVVVGARPPGGVLADVFAVLGGTLDVGPVDVGSVPVVRVWLPLHEQLSEEAS
jgi:signal transduction histidine kinase